MSSELAAWDRTLDTELTSFRDTSDDILKFTLLGPLEVLKHGEDHAPTAPKPLQLLAMLLMRPGKVVHTDSIVHELWGDEPPRSARTTMQTYVYQLRRWLEKSDLTSENAVLATKPPGYVLQVEPAQTDLFTFQHLRRQGEALMESGSYSEAVDSLRSALSLWSGPPLANINCGPVLTAYAVNLQEQQHNTRYLRIQAEIEAGMHRDLIAELRSLVTMNPLDEELHEQLMRVLSRSGRRLEALAMYRELHRKLNEELALEPSDELQRLHRELLSVGQ
ncbi:DNA-binding transcriptional activator of the SARP family [Actinopolyspora lacussalsi subsp. righensis]|uniref:DNA-binding transcriptional activator of the SARP family n=1 Tax=Actinopolyspora righensis TaxID=995060 RepID=A0A1I6XCY4_9ACTN|nr:AfsR/SARP family transcriptional regulator [Actinopolyspora righensis]SFT36077.1 DNA-binding transcriptional activator of the SARP family [Actinopolyspora righensis]